MINDGLLNIFRNYPENLTTCELGYLIENGDEEVARKAGLIVVERFKQAVMGIEDMFQYMRKNHIIFD